MRACLQDHAWRQKVWPQCSREAYTRDDVSVLMEALQGMGREREVEAWPEYCSEAEFYSTTMECVNTSGPIANSGWQYNMWRCKLSPWYSLVHWVSLQHQSLYSKNEIATILSHFDWNLKSRISRKWSVAYHPMLWFNLFKNLHLPEFRKLDLKTVVLTIFNQYDQNSGNWNIYE